MMVKTDLEPRHVVLRKAVVTSLRDREVEHRKPRWGEECRLPRREPAQHLTLWLGEIGEGGDQRGGGEHLVRESKPLTGGKRPGEDDLVRSAGVDGASDLEQMAIAFSFQVIP